MTDSADAQSGKVSVRIDADELALLRRRAAAAGLTISELLRAGAQQVLRDEVVDAKSSAGVAALESVRAELVALRAVLLQQVEATEMLVAATREVTRVPSFLEFRARAKLELPAQKEDESATAYLVRVAQFYEALYGMKPDPESDTFGPHPAGFDLQVFWAELNDEGAENDES